MQALLTNINFIMVAVITYLRISAVFLIQSGSMDDGTEGALHSHTDESRSWTHHNGS